MLDKGIGETVSFTYVDGSTYVGVTAEILAHRDMKEAMYKILVPRKGFFWVTSSKCFEWQGPIPNGS